MKIILFFLVFFFSGVLTANSQTNVVKINAVKSNEYGVSYFLPKTVLIIDAEFSKVEKKAGQYARYAERYLGISDVISKDELYYTLDKINVIQSGIPDKEEGYLVEFKAKTVAPFVYLTKDGLLCTINAEYEESETSFAGAVEKKKTTEIIQLNPETLFTEEYLRAGSVNKMAEVAAKQIYRIRESRTDILTGEAENVPKDGAAMKLVLDQLEAQEKALTELFTGTTTVVKESAEFELVPESEMEKEILFRFSKHLGIVDPDDLSGVPVYLNLKNIDPVVEIEDPKSKKEKDKKGLVYNIPGKAAVEVFYGNTNLYKGTHQITQFGTKEVLAKSIFEDKKAPVRIYFYPQTGSIKQIIQ